MGSPGNTFQVKRGTQGPTISGDDFDEFTTDALFRGEHSVYYVGNPSTKVHKLIATSANLNIIDNYFGGRLDTVVMQDYDADDIEPAEGVKKGFFFWMTGELIGNQFGAPGLRIKYK